MARELESKESIISLKEQLLLEKERRLLEQQKNLKKLEQQNKLLREQLAASKKKDGAPGKGGGRGGRKPRNLFPDATADGVSGGRSRKRIVVIFLIFHMLSKVIKKQEKHLSCTYIILYRLFLPTDGTRGR